MQSINFEDDLNKKIISNYLPNKINLCLDNLKNGYKDCNSPSSKIPSIQIVGTNGKGSIASFIESTLIQAKINVGITTSPHVSSWTERIKVNGIKIKHNEFIDILNDIHFISFKYKLTPFERVILTSLIYFEKKK